MGKMNCCNYQTTPKTLSNDGRMFGVFCFAGKSKGQYHNIVKLKCYKIITFWIDIWSACDKIKSEMEGSI